MRNEATRAWRNANVTVKQIQMQLLDLPLHAATSALPAPLQELMNDAQAAKNAEELAKEYIETVTVFAPGESIPASYQAMGAGSGWTYQAWTSQSLVMAQYQQGQGSYWHGICVNGNLVVE